MLGNLAGLSIEQTRDRLLISIHASRNVTIFALPLWRSAAAKRASPRQIGRAVRMNAMNARLSAIPMLRDVEVVLFTKPRSV